MFWGFGGLGFGVWVEGLGLEGFLGGLGVRVRGFGGLGSRAYRFWV